VQPRRRFAPICVCSLMDSPPKRLALHERLARVHCARGQPL
jgi:hypothetical protein